jgi:hypothetical protein
MVGTGALGCRFTAFRILLATVKEVIFHAVISARLASRARVFSTRIGIAEGAAGKSR